LFNHGPRRWTLLLFLALVCACARGGGCAGPVRPGGSGDHDPAAARPGAPAAVASAAAERTRPAQPQRREQAAEGRVVRVRDGDSIVVLRGGIGVEVRLDGIDCPELNQAFGRRAKVYASELAFGRVVRMAGKGRDDYGRELAEVFLPDGRSLNRELVAAGFAWRFRRHSADPVLEAVEREARLARRGLWADPEPVPPWEHRRAARR
jgi:endonuclease YncB( thermonuclease family)